MLRYERHSTCLGRLLRQVKGELLNSGRKRLVEAVRGIYFSLLDFQHTLRSPPNLTFTLAPIYLAIRWNR